MIVDPLFSKIRFANVLLVLLFIITIIGCQPDNIQSSIFSSPICQPPCWENIYPGKTSRSEVLEVLNKLDFVDHDAITVNGEPWSIFDDFIYSTIDSGNIEIEIYFIEDNVSKINFFGKLYMKLSQAIEDFGEPKYIINVPSSGGMPLAPTSSLNIIAINPEQGIGYSFDTRNQVGKLKKEIQPETILDRIFFFNTADYEKILNAGFFSTPYLTGEETLQYLKTWIGYGSILEKYPPAIVK